MLTDTKYPISKPPLSRGRTLAIDALPGAGDYERMTADARVLVSRNPDLIVVIGSPALAAVRQHTPSIPAVFAVVADPVRAGIIESLARPGCHTTGFKFAIGGKWLELLKRGEPAPDSCHGPRKSHQYYCQSDGAFH